MVIEGLVRPRTVLLDVNESIFDLSTLAPFFTRAGLAPHALEWWFAAVLRDGFALAATEGFAEFPDLAGAAFDEVAFAAGVTTRSGQVEELIGLFAQLAPHPDVRAGLECLADARIPAVALTNSTSATASGLFERATMSSLVSRVISITDVGVWKPRAEPYLHAAKVLALAPSSLVLVAVHPWDLHGARRAGVRSAWVNRTGRAFPSYFSAPDVVAARYDDVMRALVALPDS